MLPEIIDRVLSVYSSHFQSSLGSLGTYHGHGAPLGTLPKFETNGSKGQNATAFHHVLSVLL
jgi:hypothetical protein